eukprot:CAMPEP_0119305756 /NCGR_PEP_ID=MMETSP1333-20130426/6684_1 /TAXON_ID=418940 /ORGANISM="Scyphosphaera apsteinii, Strain RCC1455" /LENGTH=518 /DNA_ID=CAMNT_0007308931 /DNA_START=124 /DNA_END=1680 /DNA_ORIENTATION=+
MVSIISAESNVSKWHSGLLGLGGCPEAGGCTCSVADFGAIGDGSTDDTLAFEMAIAACASSLPTSTLRRALVPSGGVFLIRPIFLVSSLELFIQRGARIIGVMNNTEWPLINAPPSHGTAGIYRHAQSDRRHAALISGAFLENVTIRGEGPESIIDAQGWYWGKIYQQLQHGRPHLLELRNSRNLVLANVALQDPPFWTSHFLECDGVYVHGVSVTTSGKNTDGWTFDSSRNVLIERSTYRGSDDCVSIKSGFDCFGAAFGGVSANITVRNLTCSGHSAGVAIGSEVSGGVNNVTVERVHFLNAGKGAAHIKTGTSRGGFITNIAFRDLSFAANAQATNVIKVDAFEDYGSFGRACVAGVPQLRVRLKDRPWRPPAPTLLANITFQRIDARDVKVKEEAIHLHGNAESPITGVFFDQIFLPRRLPTTKAKTEQITQSYEMEQAPYGTSNSRGQTGRNKKLQKPNKHPGHVDSANVSNGWYCAYVHGSVLHENSIRPWSACTNLLLKRNNTRHKWMSYA